MKKFLLLLLLVVFLPVQTAHAQPMPVSAPVLERLIAGLGAEQLVASARQIMEMTLHIP